MHDETSATDELGGVRVDVQRESKQDLSFGTLLKETGGVKAREQVSQTASEGGDATKKTLARQKTSID